MASENLSTCLFWALFFQCKPHLGGYQGRLLPPLVQVHEAAFPAHPEDHLHQKGLWIPAAAAAVLQKADSIALSKGDCLPDDREIWRAKIGLRYCYVSVGCKNRQQMLGFSGVMKEQALKEKIYLRAVLWRGFIFILEADPVSISLLNMHAEADRVTNQIAWVSVFLILRFSAQKYVLPLPVKVILLNSLTAVSSRAKRHPFIYIMQVYTEQTLESPKSMGLAHPSQPACTNRPWPCSERLCLKGCKAMVARVRIHFLWRGWLGANGCFPK